MCSIFGAYGHRVDLDVLERIAELARDRGRNGGRVQEYTIGNKKGVLGHWRATPTTESIAHSMQPYGGIVHNGTIANDAELGNQPGAVDSMVLQHVLDRSNAKALAKSLSSVIGSYALGIVGTDRMLLATNYKPIYLIRHKDAIYFSSMERHLIHLSGLGVRPQRMQPYSVLDLETGETVMLQRETSNKALVIASAGLDSTTAAYKLKADGYDVSLLHFVYGCRAESREVDRIQQIGKHLNADVIILPIDYSQFQGKSPLFTDGDIADSVTGAEYAHEWVPARNLVMIAHAVAYAEANGYGAIALGNNLEESGAYPDNEEEFTNLLNHVLDYAVHDSGHVQLLAPVGTLMKPEIVALGTALGVPYSLTWSCYKDGDTHCGKCGPCFMRRSAFERNNIPDPTRYAA